MTGTFEGVGSLQFTPDNKYCWAYSGPIPATAGGHTAMLEFTTEGEYIVSKINFGNTSTASDHIEFEIQLNDNVIMAAIGDAIDGRYPLGYLEILIPPFTKCEITTINASGGADRSVFCSVTGKVGGAIEQQNLESITDDNKWAEKGPF